MKGVKLLKMYYNSNDNEVEKLLETKRKNYLILRGPYFTLITKRTHRKT